MEQRNELGDSQGPSNLHAMLLQKLTTKSTKLEMTFTTLGMNLCHVISVIAFSISCKLYSIKRHNSDYSNPYFTDFYIFCHYRISCQRDDDNRYCKYIKKYIWTHTYITEYQTAMCNLSCQMCFESYVYIPERYSVICWRADIWIIIVSVWTKNRQLISQPFLTSLNSFNLTMQKLFPKQTTALYPCQLL